MKRSKTLRESWPWNAVRGFTAFSHANGKITVEPDWINKWKDPKEGGGPGLFTRMDMAEWIAIRLNSRAGKRERKAT